MPVAISAIRKEAVACLGVGSLRIALVRVSFASPHDPSMNALPWKGVRDPSGILTRGGVCIRGLQTKDEIFSALALEGVQRGSLCK